MAKILTESASVMSNSMARRAFLIFFWLFFAMQPSAEGKQWRDIVPLHSTRADVERLLPRSVTPGDHASFHRLPNEVVQILYASGPPCGETLVNSWKVAKGTVIDISVSPRSEIRFSSLGLDPSRYQKFQDAKLESHSYFINEEEGVRYSVQEVEGIPGGIVIEALYFPSAEDGYLRCESSSKSSRMRLFDSHNPFDQYGNIPFDHEKSFLDNFAIYLNNQAPNFKAYIVVYSDSKKGIDKAKRRGRRAKNYLVTVRRVKAERIKTLYGGIRREPEIELYALPRGLPTPGSSTRR